MYRVPDHIPAPLRNVPELIRVWSLQESGRFRELREELLQLRQRRIKPAWSLALARAARFASMPGMALRLLERRVRASGDSGKIREGARPAEVAEYALALNDLGASREALEIFSRVDRKQVYDAYSLEAMIHLRRWDWHQARRLYEAALSAPNSTEYGRISSSHFIASCLLYGSDDAKGALAVLGKAVEQARERGHANLESSCRLLEAQAYYALGDRDSAMSALKPFREFAERERQPILLLLAEKWGHLLNLGISPLSARAGIADVARRLLASGAWEWARSCDYHLALGSKDAEAFRRAYFGTPYRRFRERIAALWAARFGEPAPVGESLDWDVPLTAGSPAKSAKPVDLDALTGKNSSGPGLLKPGQVPQRLLLTLASDFYRPLSTGTIHEKLYPGEYFRPESSVAKIHQALQRLRKWLSTEGIPLVIEETEGLYLLRATAPCRIRVPAPVMLERWEELREKLPHIEVTRALHTLSDVFRERSFSSTEAARALGVSRASANRYLAEALRLGALHSRGRARATRYLLTSRT